MKNKTTPALVGIAIALTIGVAVIEFGSRPQQQAVEADQQRLVRIEPDDVAAITLTTPIDELTVVRQDDATWQITAPLETGVEITTLDDFLATLTTITPTTRLEAVTSWADLGLEPAQASLSLNLNSGETLELGLGATTFDDLGRYARLNDDPSAAIVGVEQASRLTPTLFDLRDKSLLNVNRDELSAIALETPDETWTIERQDGEWRSPESPTMPLSTGAIDTFINQVSFLQASAFVAETTADLASFGLDSPSLSVTLSRTEGDPLSLRLGEAIEITPPGTYITTSAIAGVATVSTDATAPWPRRLEDLRDRRIADIAPTLIGTVEITAANPALSRSLTRKPIATDTEPTPEPTTTPDPAATGEPAGDEFWLISDQPEREVLLDVLFQPLIEAEVISFVATDAADAIDTSAPTLSLELQGRDGLDLEPIRISLGESEGQVWATSSYQPDVMLLPQDTLRSLQGTVGALQPLPSAAEPDEIEEGSVAPAPSQQPTEQPTGQPSALPVETPTALPASPTPEASDAGSDAASD